MKQQIVAAILGLLSVFANTAIAQDFQKQEFSYIGISTGVGFTSTMPKPSSGNTYIGVRGGHLWAANTKVAAGFEIGLTGGPQKIMVTPALIGMISLDDRGIFALVPHIGYAHDTGAAAGIDLNIGLAGNSQSVTLISAGLTRFENDLGGNKNLFKVGISRLF